MKLRFEINQAECFRRGIDTPKSIITIEVDPATIPVEERNLIADRLIGIDVCQTQISVELFDANADGDYKEQGEPIEGQRIMASDPTYEGLIKAVLQDDEYLKKESEDLTRRRLDAQKYEQIAREALKAGAGR